MTTADECTTIKNVNVYHSNVYSLLNSKKKNWFFIWLHFWAYVHAKNVNVSCDKKSIQNKW